MNKEQEFIASLKAEIDTIPQDVKDKFVPPIRTHFNWHQDFFARLETFMNDHKYSNDNVELFWQDHPALAEERNNLLADAGCLLEKFKKAGGNDHQWNCLAQAMDIGFYDEIYPENTPNQP